MRFSSRARVAGRRASAAEFVSTKTAFPLDENASQRGCEIGRVAGLGSFWSRFRKAGTSLISAAETKAVVGWGHWLSSRKPFAICRLSSAWVIGERDSFRERLTGLVPDWSWLPKAGRSRKSSGEKRE